MSVEHIVETLKDLLEEELPRGIRAKIESTIKVLENNTDSVVVSRVLQELGEAAESSNIQSHHRMMLFNVVSLLEAV
ncbi:MAG: UPF0147 family protein [Candidatus Nanoarchaeia archaeon]